jgi:hypothetical protein
MKSSNVVSSTAVAAVGSGAASSAAGGSELRGSSSLPHVAPANQPAANPHDAQQQQQQQVLPSELLKPLTLYTQYLLIIGTLNIAWQAVLPLYTALGWLWAPTSSHTLSIECLLPSSSVPLPVQKLLLALAMPLVVLLVLLALRGLTVVYKLLCRRYTSRGQQMHADRGHHDNKSVSNVGIQLSQLSLVVMFFFWPMLSRTVLSMFACMRLDDSVEPPLVANAVGLWWELDMDQQCLTGYHLTWALAVGVPGVLLVCVVLPAALFTWRNRTHTEESYFQLHYGFLVQSYRRDRAWFEAVVCFQTSGVVAVSIFTAQTQIYYQALALTGAFALMGLLLAVLRPHSTCCWSRCTAKHGLFDADQLSRTHFPAVWQHSA